jgi:4-amino-4-deoxy-L-arabinose transferase-like glycosyltransferase
MTATRETVATVRLPSFRWRSLALVAGVLAVVLISLSGRYGFHRDELYFLVCGRHPAWGYPDQPPLTPLLARVSAAIGHGSLPVFRLPSVIAVAAVTMLAGLIAREFGGARFAQLLTAIACATSTFVLIAGHLLETMTVDLLVWTALSWLVVRLLRTRDERLWLAIGLVAAVGLLNKQLPLVLLLGIGLGLLISADARPLLFNRWLLGGALPAALAWAPVLAWQAANGWPQFTIAHQISDEYGSLGNRLGFVAVQFVLFSLGATYLWVTGLLRLWRDPRWLPYRPLAWAWIVVIIALLLTGAQTYYAAGIYPVLIAAGAVAVEGRSRARVIALVAVCATSLLTVPAALPVLPATALADSPWSGLGETQLETVGWPGFVDQVAAAYRSIPAGPRAEAGIFTANYGEAGAIDRYGPDRGLPEAYSGHNGMAAWGPPSTATAPVVVVWEDDSPGDYFSGCRLTGKVRGPVSNEETDRASIYVCAGPIGGWDAAWPRLSHLSS